MDVMHGVSVVLALGLGAAAFVCWRGWQTARSEVGTLSERAAESGRTADRASVEVEAARREVEGLRAELGVARAQADESSRRVLTLSQENATVKERLESAEARWRESVADKQRLLTEFQAISSKTIRESQETLGKVLADRLTAADEKARAEHQQRHETVQALVRPIGETLAKTSERLAQLDERVRASGELGEQLRAETSKLTKALSRPEIRGKYGEIQLRRVAELAGMTSYCDFNEQTSTTDREGNMLRPDMVVTLPNQRMIAVDAKANIDAYMAAINAADDQERDAHLERFARHMADQAKKLGDKKYWTLFEGSPEFVVMFVPGDQFVDAALAKRPDLLDLAAQSGVILASPSTLIGLLRAVAVGWREHAVSEQARELIKLGAELHQRASVVFEHADKLGRSLNQSVNGYNLMVGSMEGRLTPTLRKFEELGAKSGKELAELKPVEGETRALLETENNA
jgi:DNA recombination protein RmuC